MPVTRQSSRGDVLDVALRVFSERGYGETSLRQLIAEARMSPTAFYARYPSKQAVLEALIERVVADVFVRASKVMTGASTVDDAFDALPDALVAALVPHKAGVRLMFTEAAVVPPLRRTLYAAYTTFARLVGSQLAKVKVPAAESAGWAMFGAVAFQIMRWAVFEELDDAQFAKELRVTNRLLRSLVR
jgi:AcrR family transcriptional regulator